MGSSQSHLYIKPLLFADCFKGSNLDIFKYQVFLTLKRKREEEEDHIINSAFGLNGVYTKKRAMDNTLSQDKEKRRKDRSVKKHDLVHTDLDGNEKVMTWKDSLWHTLYISNSPTRTNRQRKLFRQRFRLPYNDFLQLVEEVESNEMFARWCGKDAVGIDASPIKLLVLGFLRYTGRGFTFDDLEEATNISREVHRQFLHIFIEYGSTVLWEKHVVKTESQEDAEYNEKLFSMAGLPGCIGSTDGTVVALERCADWAQNKHKGFKLNKPSRNYNVTCNHSREFIGCTQDKKLFETILI